TVPSQAARKRDIEFMKSIPNGQLTVEPIRDQVLERQIELLLVLQMSPNQTQPINFLLDLENPPAHLPQFLLLFAGNIVLGIQLRRRAAVAVKFILRAPDEIRPEF